MAIKNFLWFSLKIFCAFCQHICICISYLKNLHKRVILGMPFFILAFSLVCQAKEFSIWTLINSAHFKMMVPHFSIFLAVQGFLYPVSYWWTLQLSSFCYCAKCYHEVTHLDEFLWVHPIGNILSHGLSGSKIILVPFKVCCSITKLCPTLCDAMDCSMPEFPIPHHHPEFAQVHIHWIGDAIQPSHPLLSPSPPGGGNGKPLKYTCCQNPMNCIKRQSMLDIAKELPERSTSPYSC